MERLISPGSMPDLAWGAALQLQPSPAAFQPRLGTITTPVAPTPRSAGMQHAAAPPPQAPVFASPAPAAASALSGGLPPRHPQVARPMPVRSPVRHLPPAAAHAAAPASPAAGAAPPAAPLIRPTPLPASSTAAGQLSGLGNNTSQPALLLPTWPLAPLASPAVQRSPQQPASAQLTQPDTTPKDPRLAAMAGMASAASAQEASTAERGEGRAQIPAAQHSNASPPQQEQQHQQRRSPPKKLIDPVPHLELPPHLAQAKGATRMADQGLQEGASSPEEERAAREEGLAGAEWQPEAFLNDYGSEGGGEAPPEEEEEDGAVPGEGHASSEPDEDDAAGKAAGPAEEQDGGRVEANEQADGEQRTADVPEHRAAPGEEEREAVPEVQAERSGGNTPSLDIGAAGDRWRSSDPSELVDEAIARVTSLCADLDVSDRPPVSGQNRQPSGSLATNRQQSGSAARATAGRSKSVISPAAGLHAGHAADARSPHASAQQQHARADAAAAERDDQSNETLSMPHGELGVVEPGDGGEEVASPAAGHAEERARNDSVQKGTDPEPAGHAAGVAETAAAQPAAAQPARPVGLAGSSLRKRPAAAAAAAAQEHSSGSGQCSTLTSHVGLPDLAMPAARSGACLQAESAQEAAAEEKAGAPSSRKAAKKGGKRKRASRSAAAGPAEPHEEQQGVPKQAPDGNNGVAAEDEGADGDWEPPAQDRHEPDQAGPENEGAVPAHVGGEGTDVEAAAAPAAPRC